MQCIRCHGSVIRERVYDWLENDGQFYVSGWRWVSRCAECGHAYEGIKPQTGRQSMPLATERGTVRYEE